MKLNYRLQINNKDKNDTHSELRNETKLSMQSLVSQVLASKMPASPASPASPSSPSSPISSPASNTGWGKSN